MQIFHCPRTASKDSVPTRCALNRSCGQGLVEYLVLTCLVAVAAISVVSTVGRNIREHYANISSALTRGEARSVRQSEVDPEALEGRAMHNYMQNASSGSNRSVGGRAGQ